MSKIFKNDAFARFSGFHLKFWPTNPAAFGLGDKGFRGQAGPGQPQTAAWTPSDPLTIYQPDRLDPPPWVLKTPACCQAYRITHVSPLMRQPTPMRTPHAAHAFTLAVAGPAWAPMAPRWDRTLPQRARRGCWTASAIRASESRPSLSSALVQQLFQRWAFGLVCYSPQEVSSPRNCPLPSELTKMSSWGPVSYPYPRWRSSNYFFFCKFSLFFIKESIFPKLNKCAYMYL